ncbi:L,D-transpeptidase [Thiocapsa imhoffii]|uniref:L,D-transpeptidase n=1 Tax=Thiocapsa imhoffii TaxID=382777 RepID=A0A9X0WL54_9GAMM|nr:L,D-transpeptidase [Thiocapsa imhoffii]MBK1646771.1 L,D-transpeptidase [Thiocapsa imhoffii]
MSHLNRQPSRRPAWQPALTALALAFLLSHCAPTPTRPAIVSDPAGPGVPMTNAPPADVAAAISPQQRALKIHLESQEFVYTENDQIVRTGPISSGKEGHATPRGEFSVLSKQQDKVSYRYTNQLGWNAWMPYSIQFSGHYFLHEGWLPGYPDSHGCVRVGERDARFLFERLQLGDAISVVD